MCKKCNYKIRELLKSVTSEDPDKCFIQRGLNSDNARVRLLANSAVKAIMADMSIDEFVNRLYESFKNNESLEAAKREAYREFLSFIPFFSDLDEENEKYKEEVYGGLIQ